MYFCKNPIGIVSSTFGMRYCYFIFYVAPSKMNTSGKVYFSSFRTIGKSDFFESAHFRKRVDISDWSRPYKVRKHIFIERADAWRGTDEGSCWSTWEHGINGKTRKIDGFGWFGSYAPLSHGVAPHSHGAASHVNGASPSSTTKRVGDVVYITITLWSTTHIRVCGGCGVCYI